tara:strand:+ start:1349 stop:2245 length:897 start_codon:yes stop_codon:yes gene_type:complete
MIYHKPVLLNESIDGLKIKPNGIYVDVTFGGGGHSKEIIKRLKQGFLYAFDQDADAIQNKIIKKNFKLIRGNFRFIKNFLRLEGVEKIDGLIADLGISSFQIDFAERGFAHRLESKIDMRMNKDADLDAVKILNTYSENEIARVLYEYGDLTNAKKIAQKIIKARSEEKISSTKQLKKILQNFYPKKIENKFLSKFFQAIRIEVNDEINALKDLLNDVIDLLNRKGRLVVISYHSLEDKLVKNLITKGNIEGKSENDFFGNKRLVFSAVNKKVIVPNDSENIKNTRARSAKLRIAEKI